ncbi:MAG: type II toxin-antitoxin system RelE family toxin [Chloroflexota bacterium]
MPVRVELTNEAMDDLRRYVASGNLRQFLAKLVRLEDVGKDAGLPLGRGLTGWRKIVVGDRNWRIVFSMNASDTVATVWVIGDREDGECYDEAMRRLAKHRAGDAESSSLATIIFRLMQARQERRGGRS